MSGNDPSVGRCGNDRTNGSSNVFPVVTLSRTTKKSDCNKHTNEKKNIPITVENGTAIPHLVHVHLVSMNRLEAKAGHVRAKVLFIIPQLELLHIHTQKDI